MVNHGIGFYSLTRLSRNARIPDITSNLTPTPYNRNTGAWEDLTGLNRDLRDIKPISSFCLDIIMSTRG